MIRARRLRVFTSRCLDDGYAGCQRRIRVMLLIVGDSRRDILRRCCRYYVGMFIFIFTPHAIFQLFYAAASC